MEDGPGCHSERPDGPVWEAKNLSFHSQIRFRLLRRPARALMVTDRRVVSEEYVGSISSNLVGGGL